MAVVQAEPQLSNSKLYCFICNTGDWRPLPSLVILYYEQTVNTQGAVRMCTNACSTLLPYKHGLDTPTQSCCMHRCIPVASHFIIQSQERDRTTGHFQRRDVAANQ